jgi:hypothetical protein
MIEETRMKLNKIVTGLAFAATFAASQAMAASDGTVGTTSTGTADVTLEIQDIVQISGVDNIGLGAWSGSGDLTGASEFCVYRSDAGDYKLKLTTGSGSFDVTSPTTLDSIAFTVQVDDDLDATVGGESLLYGADTAVALTGSNSYTCGGAENAEIHVTFAEAALQAASTGNDYSETVTVLVTPI